MISMEDESEISLKPRRALRGRGRVAPRRTLPRVANGAIVVAEVAGDGAHPEPSRLLGNDGSYR